MFDLGDFLLTFVESAVILVGLFCLTRYLVYRFYCSSVKLDDAIQLTGAIEKLVSPGRIGRTYETFEGGLLSPIDADTDNYHEDGGDYNYSFEDNRENEDGCGDEPPPDMLVPPMAAIADEVLGAPELETCHASEVGVISDGLDLVLLGHTELDDSLGPVMDGANELTPLKVMPQLKRASSANTGRPRLDTDAMEVLAWKDWWLTSYLVYGTVVALVLSLAKPGLEDALAPEAEYPIQQRAFWASVFVSIAIGAFALCVSPVGWSPQLVHLLFRIGIVCNAALSIVEYNYKNWPGFVINGAIAFVVTYHYVDNYDSFAFAQTLLSASASCFSDNMAGFVTVLVCISCGQCSWVLIWGVAANRVLKGFDGPDSQMPVDPEHEEMAIARSDYNNPLVFPVVCVLFFVLLAGVALLRFYAEAMMAGVVTSWCVRPRCKIPVRASLHQVSQWSFVATWYGAVYIPVVGVVADVLGMVSRLLLMLEQVLVTGTLFAVRSGTEDAPESPLHPATPPRLSPHDTTSHDESDIGAALAPAPGGWRPWLSRRFSALCAYVCVLHRRMLHLQRRLNRYSVAVAVARGYPVQTSGLYATLLFKKRGWVAIAEDGSLKSALSFAELLVCCLGIQLGFIASKCIQGYGGQGPEFRLTTALCTAGGLMGYAIGNTFASCFFTGTMAMVYTLAHDRGNSLCQSQPLRYQELSSAWNRDHPNAQLSQPEYITSGARGKGG